MKIIIGSESYYPTISGVAVTTHCLARGLHARGHEVHIICPSLDFHSYTEEKEGIHIHRIRGIKNPFRPKLRISFFPRSHVDAIIGQVNPDVVHLQDPTSICSEVLRSARIRNIPVVITNHFSFEYVLSYLPWLKPFHGIIAYHLENYLVRLYNRCNYITFPSETIKKQFASHRLTVPSIAISNGVNLDQFYPSFNYDEMRTQLNLPKKPIILHVGRLDQDKKTDQIIEGFAMLRETCDAQLVICGDGTQKQKLMDRAQELHIAQHISFLGHMDHDKDLPQLYQMATVFTSASTIETQGIVLLEAMASALPLVVPNAGALPELVHNKENGLLYKPNDIRDLADKLAIILKDTRLARAMGDRGLQMVEEHQIERSFDKFEKIYDELAHL